MRLFVLFAALSLAGCVAAPPRSAAPLTQLTGPTWRMIEFQSSDDAIGTLRPASGESYELTFQADGRVTGRIACNRGSGTWTSATQSASGGALSIGPMAVTRMACLNAQLESRVLRDLGNVASFTLRDGELFLALQADGGIYRFAPLPQAK